MFTAHRSVERGHNHSGWKKNRLIIQQLLSWPTLAQVYIAD